MRCTPKTAAVIETGVFLGASLGVGLGAAVGKAISISNIAQRQMGEIGIGISGRAIGIVPDTRYAQHTSNPIFSKQGSFAGKSIDDIAATLRSSQLKPTNVPIGYIIREGSAQS